MSKNQPGPEAKRKIGDSVSDERMAGPGDSGRDLFPTRLTTTRTDLSSTLQP